MRALLKKELTELLVPFGIAFLIIAITWLVSVRFWDALLPLPSGNLMVVASTSAIGGAVLGYLQFSAERWRGKLAYFCHRGTGIEGAFLAKVIAGLGATALVGFGPPLLYALATSLTSPNASIIQWSLLASYASAATAGASLYGLGALAASLGRRSVAGVMLLLFGIFGIGMLSERCGTPWGSASTPWLFPALHLALAAVLLGVALRLVMSIVDRELPLPRGAYAAVMILAVPLVLRPCDRGASVLTEELLDSARSEYPRILRDRDTDAIFPVVRDEEGGYFRLGLDGHLGPAVDATVRFGEEPRHDDVFYGNGPWGGSDGEPPVDRFMSMDMYSMRSGLMSIEMQYRSLLHESSYTPNVRIHLDRDQGVVRAFGYFAGPVRPSPGAGLRPYPFQLELGKPEGEHRFSPATVVLRGEDSAVQRLAQSLASEEPAPPPPWIPGYMVGHFLGKSLGPSFMLESCLLDPSDGSFWKLDVLDVEAPIERIELPAGDRFVRLQSLYQRDDLVYGRYQSAWADPVIVGDRGQYVWNGRELVAFVGSESHVTLDEAQDLVRYQVVVEGHDPVRWTVRVHDIKENREAFTCDYAPRTRRSSVMAAAAQWSVLLRSPLANTLVFLGLRHRWADGEKEAGSDFLAGGRDPWLWAIDLVVAVGCAWTTARILRRRLASAVKIVLCCSFVLLFGPAAVLVVWLLEPRRHARVIPSTAPVPEPALVIQTA